MGNSRGSLIKALADTFADPDKERAKKEMEKFDVRTNTLYAEGKRRHDDPVVIVNEKLEFTVETEIFTDILYDRKRHHILLGTHYHIGDFVSIRETKNWRPTDRVLIKEILYVTPGDGQSLNKEYSIIQW